MEDRGHSLQRPGHARTLLERREGGGDHQSERKGSKKRLDQSSLGLEEGQSAEGVKAIEGLSWECGGGREEGGSGFREISVVARTRLGNLRAWRGAGWGVRDNLKVSSWDDQMQDGHDGHAALVKVHIGLPVGRRHDSRCVRIMPDKTPTFPGGDVQEGAAFEGLKFRGGVSTEDADWSHHTSRWWLKPWTWAVSLWCVCWRTGGGDGRPWGAPIWRD